MDGSKTLKVGRGHLRTISAQAESPSKALRKHCGGAQGGSAPREIQSKTLLVGHRMRRETSDDPGDTAGGVRGGNAQTHVSNGNSERVELSRGNGRGHGR